MPILQVGMWLKRLLDKIYQDLLSQVGLACYQRCLSDILLKVRTLGLVCDNKRVASCCVILYSCILRVQSCLGKIMHKTFIFRPTGQQHQNISPCFFLSIKHHPSSSYFGVPGVDPSYCGILMRLLLAKWCDGWRQQDTSAEPGRYSKAHPKGLPPGPGRDSSSSQCWRKFEAVEAGLGGSRRSRAGLR